MRCFCRSSLPGDGLHGNVHGGISIPWPRVTNACSTTPRCVSNSTSMDTTYTSRCCRHSGEGKSTLGQYVGILPFSCVKGSHSIHEKPWCRILDSTEAG